VLQVGADNSVFPIPLGQNSEGRWYFDTAAGKDEMLARRIGINELTGMDACQAIAGAQQLYGTDHPTGNNGKEYAEKFVSDPGQQNGLYWAAVNGQTPSPLGQMGDFTKALSSRSGSQNSPLFNGYYYRILTRGDTPNGIKDYVAGGKMTGGFAILAYPSDYRYTGIMSFLIGEDGRLYQKDLGEKTAEIAPNMAEANPRDGWTSLDSATNLASQSQEQAAAPLRAPGAR
jgi:hypothetical protein